MITDASGIVETCRASAARADEAVPRPVRSSSCLRLRVEARRRPPADRQGRTLRVGVGASGGGHRGFLSGRVGAERAICERQYERPGWATPARQRVVADADTDPRRRTASVDGDRREGPRQCTKTQRVAVSHADRDRMARRALGEPPTLSGVGRRTTRPGEVRDGAVAAYLRTLRHRPGHLGGFGAGVDTELA